MAVRAEQLLRVQLDQLPEDHPEKAFLQGQVDVFAAYNAARRDGVASNALVEPPKVEAMSRQAVEAEIEGQAARYIDLEFHKQLRMSKGAFKDHVMSLVIPQPESFTGRFDIPVVGFGQIPVEDQARMAGIENWLGGLNVRDWEQDPGGYRTPGLAYLSFMQDGSVNINRSPRDVRASLATDERGATIQDGIGLYIARPQVLNHHFVDLPGTRVESDYVAFLDLWRVRPRLFSGLAGNASPGFGSASSGRV